MDKQGYEEIIAILTRIVNKQHDSIYGICDALDNIEGVTAFYARHIECWEDIAASGRKHYPITTATEDRREAAYDEFWNNKASQTLYADTPYGDARRRLAAFLLSKAEEELAVLEKEDA